MRIPLQSGSLSTSSDLLAYLRIIVEKQHISKKNRKHKAVQKWNKTTILIAETRKAPFTSTDHWGEQAACVNQAVLSR